MRLAVMQPYFLPYPGYIQLLALADRFVLHDDLKFTRSGWVHRNRYLRGGAPAWMTLPLRRDADDRAIRERVLADDFPMQRDRLIRRVAAAYAGAPYRRAGMDVLESCLDTECLGVGARGLFDVVFQSLRLVCRTVGIDAGKLVVSSTLGIDPALRGQDRVLAICRAMGADRYVNPPGGRHLYSAADFRRAGVELSFLEPRLSPYPQFGHPFVPALSILDALMFTGAERVRSTLGGLDDAVLADQ